MLSEKELATNFATSQHIARVRDLLNLCVVELLRRGELHDQSKLVPPEVTAFTEHTERLKGLTYGSEEYTECLKQLGPALQHHYANNRHHPEHHKEGVNDMNLLDVVEMLMDWKAASERHNDGNIKKSIVINAGRFGISSQMQRILENTVKDLGL